MSDVVELTQHEHIFEIALNRPEAYNAFNLETVVSLADHLTRLAKEDAARGIVITGKGKAFCAGGDLKWTVGYSQKPGASFHKLASQFHLAILEIRRMPKPVIAAIQGTAAGGGFSLALACDFRIMEKSARFKQAYTSSGLCIDGGGTFSLPRLVGLARAMEIAAFDEPISAQQALDWGLITKIVEDGDAKAQAIDMARQLARRSLHAFGTAKQLLTDSFSQTFEAQMERERRGLAACAEHAEGREGLLAFIEKRKPVFQ